MNSLYSKLRLSPLTTPETPVHHHHPRRRRRRKEEMMGSQDDELQVYFGPDYRYRYMYHHINYFEMNYYIKILDHKKLSFCPLTSLLHRVPKVPSFSK